MKYACVIVFISILSFADIKCSENDGVSVALKLYEDCSKSDGFSPCLKKKAIALLDRIARMKEITLSEGITVKHEVDDTTQTSLSDEQLDATLPRGLDAKDAALSDIIIDKAVKFFQASSLDISPKLIEGETEGFEARKKKKGMGGAIAMIIGKLLSLIPVAIAGLFLLAGKALITSKIALLLAGIIAIKKLVAAKHSQPHVEHVQASAGWHGGHGHGGWDKRSLDEAQNIAYSAHVPQQ